MEIPKLVPVKSSGIHSLGYSSIEQKGKLERNLFVKFNSGKLYRFIGVHEEIYKKLLRSSSVGVLFNEIVAGNYDYEILENA